LAVAPNMGISRLEGDYETFVKSLVAGQALPFKEALEEFHAVVRK
jgi:hypothetical protein